MSEEILINVTPQETRVAVVENGVLQEVHIERASHRGLVGNIYKGRVSRFLPGMQAAFVDIGLERTAFLQTAEMKYGNGAGAPALVEGQDLTVQVVKDPIGTKGARLTTQISLPARYVVYMPTSDHIGISQKIDNEEERERLRAAVRSAMGDEPGGFILRTMAEQVSEEELRRDIHYLRKLWQRVSERMREPDRHGLVHEDLSLVLRAMRDLVRDNIEKVRIDSREMYTKAQEFALEFVPDVAPRIEYYPGERPIFDLYSVEDEIKRALDRRVALKSGGYLVIDQTEAMTTVDVNTGTYVGHRNLAETIFKTNLEAAHAIARQLRLRNLGGMIIVDFIDMGDPDHKRQVLRALERALARDRVKASIADMSALGLVEITRKRTRESLEHLLCETCPACKGRGVLKTPETVTYEIFREILREARQFGTDQYLVVASQVVVDRLSDDQAQSLARLQEFIGKPIHLQVEPLYNQEEYEVVLT
ncbi:ribonuclease G [Acidiferrobacter sp. SPIII_3]|uniref:ribonuclease G n=1 Tax=Acidiferrobacter sp. SPIII_3 TaxID=1281578 RepID=UPI000D73B20F|nr:ribonuclease G [Acidiferrobacter sp. SPIII_3]AWP22418.1 ribonuclease G [Acidiferrobacter sp. SPIII_3]